MPGVRTPLPKIEDYPAFLEAAWEEHLAPREPNAPTVVSLFAGCGGSSLGYSMAGFRELLAVEWDNNAVETFRLNFPDVPVYHGDIAALSVDECLALSGLMPGQLDVLDGSPPCQGFSTAGKRNLDDDRNQLFREYVRLLRGLRPRVFIMENVSGMVKGKMRLVFADIMRELKGSGYRVSARLLNAMYFGVPQSRQRMIFVGVREDVKGEPTHPDGRYQPVRVREALPHLCAVVPTAHGFTKADDLALDGIAPSVPASGGASYTGHWCMVHDDSRPKSRRQVTESPAPTGRSGRAGTLYVQTGASAAVYPDGGTLPSPAVMSGRVAGIELGGQRRKFTSNEVKAICSYPYQYAMVGTYHEQWERLGNSVPPLFMRAIARHVRRTILEA